MFPRISHRLHCLTRSPSAHRCVLTAARTGACGGPLQPKKVTSAAEAVRAIESGNRVFIHSVVGAPQALIKAMSDRHTELKGLSCDSCSSNLIFPVDVEVTHIHTEGPAPYADASRSGAFRTRVMFIGKNMREAVRTGLADYVPVFLGEVPGLFRNGVLPLDVALITVSPPDRHGFCSLGASIDVSVAAVQAARTVIAQVNHHMPRTHGDGMLHVSQLDVMYECNEPLFEHAHENIVEGSAEALIGKQVAALVEDGATLQMGIGSIPDAVLAELKHHKNLGIHTEMFSDGVIPLLQSGAINNSQKTVRPGKLVSSFAMGTRDLYNFMDDNSSIDMRDVSWVNDVQVIARNRKVTAINSAIEVDLTGQVCADSIGTRVRVALFLLPLSC
eukprot:TRINITY_DN1802_c0_g1_i1.p1 TRINITY_DN1802_c0_g1~~TRINITY_DN1802_c0_g1_i1.p1  ORF type:complete len:388 (+),score=64.10 TRINITY_DN1802_c0_g1_i1:68-1231(+)